MSRVRPRPHAGILQIVFVALLFVSVELLYKLQKSFLPQSVLQVLAHCPGEKFGPVHQQGYVFPVELPNDTGENQDEPALAVGHPGQSGVLGLVLEHALQGIGVSRGLVARCSSQEWFKPGIKMCITNKNRLYNTVC